jgi:polygalacturonase
MILEISKENTVTSTPRLSVKQLGRCGLLFVLVITAQSRAQAPASGIRVFNILDYGAKNDASTPATDAFRAAIQAAKAAGGGTVFVPAGAYVTGPIEMVSNLTLYIDAGATLRFPATPLPFSPGRQQGIETLTPVPLIGGHDLENVAVIGRGTLTSNNQDWIKLHNRALRSVSDAGSANGPNWEHLLQALNANKPISEEDYRAAAAELRPSFIRFMNSSNVLIDGLHFVGSPMWTIHLLYSRNAVVENVVIETFPGVHADGIVVDSSRFVKLANDYIDAGDDGIVIKSGKDADGLRVNRPTEDVAITNCTVHHAQSALAIGSETSGSVHNIVASNFTVVNTVNGIHIKSRRGRGGVVEDVRFDNWTMENVGAAITVSDAGYQMEGEAPDPGEGPVSRKTPVFRNIAISNITVNGARSLINLEGIPEMPISGLRISNVTGIGRTGLRARYTDDLEISDVRLSPEAGPAFEVRDSTNLELDHVSTPKPLANTPVIRLEATPGAIVRDSKAFPGTDIFVSIPPDELKNLLLQNNLTANARTPVSTNAKEDWPAAAPVTRELCLVQFGSDPANLTRVDNQSRICLDIIAQTLQRSPGAGIVLIGNPGTSPNASQDAIALDRSHAAERATNSKNYLVQEKGIDPSRVQVYIGATATGGPEDIDKIEAEMVAGVTVDGNVESVLVPKGTAISSIGLTSMGIMPIP